jgi:hypothetical protein
MEITRESNDIGALVRKAEQDFVSGQTQTSKYVQESIFDDINQIEAYLNSKHISGDKDSLNRDKPFFNIVLAKKNITARATDLDRKHIIAKANKSKDLLASYLYTIHLQKWMNQSNFGMFLNIWGDYLAAYNSAVTKFVEQDGEMKAQVIPWNRIICDVIDFDANPVIEVIELTPAQLRMRKGYDKEQVEALINAVSARESLDKMKKDQKSNYIKLYEIHGNLPLSYITGKDTDEEDYVQQMHVMSFVASKEKGGFDDYTLISGREKKTPYMLTWLIPSVDGSISLMGSVKSLFDAQWMVNHSIKAIKDQLDLASKLIFQTSDGNFVGQNALSAIESGDILVTKVNEPLTQLANNSHDITSLQAFGQQWQVLAQELVSTPDIMSGQNMPSGTAWRQAAIIQQEAHGNFELMTENKGLHLERMFRDYVTPYLLKKMNTTEEISTTLDAYGIDKIDAMYISTESAKNFNKKAVDAVLNDTELPDLAQEEASAKQNLQEMGSMRFIKPSEIDEKTWKDILGEFEGDVVYEITGENRDKQAVMATLSTVFGVIAQNPMILQDPNARMVFNKILEETNAISPLEIAEMKGQPQQPIPQPPQGQPVAPIGGVGAGINNQPMM